MTKIIRLQNKECSLVFLTFSAPPHIACNDFFCFVIYAGHEHVPHRTSQELAHSIAKLGCPSTKQNIPYIYMHNIYIYIPIYDTKISRYQTIRKVHFTKASHDSPILHQEQHSPASPGASASATSGDGEMFSMEACFLMSRSTLRANPRCQWTNGYRWIPWESKLSCWIGKYVIICLWMDEPVLL